MTTRATTGSVLPAWSLLLLLAVGSPGCGGGDDADNPAAAGNVQQPKAPAKAGDEAAGEDETSDADYVYNPIGKRDPFRSFITSTEDEEIRSPTPLQKYEIDQYTLSGIVWGVDRPRALVEDPTGEGHVVELGTYIGKNWGKVTQITSHVVVVTEEYLTPDGALVVNPIEIELPEMLGENP